MKNFYCLLIIFIFTFAIFSQEAEKKSKNTTEPKAMGEKVELPENLPQTAEEYYDYADKLWRKTIGKEAARVLEYLDKAIELNPGYDEAIYFRGFVKNRTDRHKEAIEDLNRALELVPENLNAYQLRAESRIKLKDFKGGLTDFDNFITRMDVEGYYTLKSLDDRGRLRYFLGDYDGAIQDFSRAAATNRTVTPYFLRAATYLKKGDKTSALQDFKFLAEYTDRVHAESLKKYPDQYAEEEGYPYGEYPLAVLKKVDQKDSDKDGIIIVTERVSTGVIAVNSDTGERINFEDKFPNLEEKLVLDNWFDFNSKKSYLSTFIADESSVIYYYYGLLSAEQGKSSAAEEAFTKALTYGRETENAGAWFERGKIRLGDKKFEPAVKDFSWAISKNRNLINAYPERGIAILMLGHDKIAQKDFDIFLKLNPEGKEILKTRIEAAKKLRAELNKKK